MATGTTTQSVPMFFGPDAATYVQGDTLLANAQLTILWREGNWYYAEVPASGKRNYILVSMVKNVIGTVPNYTPRLQKRFTNASASARYGPSTSYQVCVTLPSGEIVYYLEEKKEGQYAMVQYVDRATGKIRRVWFEHSRLYASASSPEYSMYYTGTYSGVALHVIRTNANNISLKSLKGADTLAGSADFGINGGFFAWENKFRTLNISVRDGVVISGDGTSGTGGDTNELGRGAIYWNGTNLQYAAGVTNKNTLSGISTNGTWAQGGIGLYLGNSAWLSKVQNNEACKEEYYRESEKRERTAMVANTTLGIVYLISTMTGCNMDTFRSAIHDFLGISKTGSSDHPIYKALFLDGGRSASLRCKNVQGNTVSVRPSNYTNIVQIINLKNAN